jgi:RNA polymerase sigma-70 factor, ECF subfamily
MDEDLLCRLKDGNERAYKIIFDEYFAILTAFAYKYLHDLDTSKEITQNVFVKFYEKRNSIVITKSLKSYLFQMVYHDCISFLRNKKQIVFHSEPLEEFNGDYSDYEPNVEQAEEEYKLHQLIEKLPPQCKRIFKLSRFEYIKNEKIAEELNLSIRTVETQRSKAIKFLKSNFQLLLLLFLYI